MAAIIDWGNVHLTAKHIEFCKNKDVCFIFRLLCFYTYLLISFLASICCAIILRGSFVRVLPCVLIFFPDTIIRVMFPSTQKCFCCFSLALTELLFENFCVFYSFQKLSVSNFTIIKEENDSSLQYNGKYDGKTNFY